MTASLLARVTVYVPEAWIDAVVSIVMALGGWNDPSDGCECVYLPLVRFVLEV